MLQRAQRLNTVKVRVKLENLTARRAQWIRIQEAEVALELKFPRLDLNYLRNITIGVYQVNLSNSYKQDAF